MANQQHLLFLVSFYPTEERPHHGIFFQDHAEALAEFFDVTVIVLRNPSVKEGQKIRSTISTNEKNAVRVVAVDQPVLTHRLTNLVQRSQKKAVQKAFNTLRKHQIKQPDWIIAQTSLPPGQWALELRDKFSDAAIPFVVIEHFSFLQRMYKEQKHEVLNVYSNAKAIASVSSYLKHKVDSFLDAHHLDIASIQLSNVLGRTFEHQSFVPPSKSKPFKWLFVGPDDNSKKGIDILAEALSQLSDTDWELTVIGEGVYSDLQHKAFSDRVTLQSPVTRSTMVELMQHHHALVSSSRVETFGMAIIEMLSCGRPVVATKSGGPDEYLTENLGHLVDSENSEALAKGMAQLMASYSKYDFEAIRDSIIKRFGAQAFYTRFNQLFSQADFQN